MGINLLPWREIKYRRQLHQFSFLIILIAVLAIGSLYGWRCFLVKFFNNQLKEINTITKILDQKNNKLSAVGSSSAELKLLTKRQHQLEELILRRTEILEVLNLLPNVLPGTSKLVMLSLDKNISMIVKTEKMGDLQLILGELGKKFKVNLLANTRQEKAYHQFDLQLILPP